MSRRSGDDSPSPKSQAEVVSYRSSRAESEVPERVYDFILSTPKSCHSSVTGGEMSQCRLEENSLRSFPRAAPLTIGGMMTCDGAQGEGIGVGGVGRRGHRCRGNRCKWQREAGVHTTPDITVMDGVGGQEGAVNTKAEINFTDLNQTREINKALYHSVPHSGAAFKLLQKIGYPFDPPSAQKKDGLVATENTDVMNDDGFEYEAMGEPHIMNGTDAAASRSVLRRGVETVESGVSTMAMCMLPDILHECPVFALCVGDANGRVSYCEVPVGHAKHPCCLSSVLRKSKSNMSAATRSQTDVDVVSVPTSIFSDPFTLNSDFLGCQRSPVRKHSHQAYVQEMDCLTSVTIMQSVKTLRFLRTHESPNTVSYLASNERVIKLFQVRRDGFSLFDAFPSMETVVGRRLASTHYFPRAAPSSPTLPMRVFSGYHTNPIQSLSICSDGQSFLSVDDLQVFWWSLEGGTESSKATCITDFRPLSGRMDEVEELVTAAAFHPSDSSIFLVSRSSGVFGIGDLRDPISGSNRKYSSSFRVTNDGIQTSQEHYSDILCSISDADFLGPNHIVTRDYLSLKLWDLRRTDAPCSMAPVMSHVAPYLDIFYENDAIFDRFPVVVDHISKTVVTGLYDGAVAVWQPLYDGHIDPDDVLVHYRADPLALHCEVENGGRTTVKTLSASLERDSLMPVASPSNGGELTPGDLPEPLANKVMNVSIVDGGERFAFTCKDDRCIFIFEREAKANSCI